MKKFQVDTPSVREIGTAIVNDAQADKTSADPHALDNLRSDLQGVVPHMPQILQGELSHFNSSFYKGFSDVLDQRMAIGHILLGTASETEKNEVRTVNWFLDNPPQVLVK